MDKKMDIRVAKILDDEKIVINKGSLDKIDKDMEFVVYEETEEIIDPITKKSLGLLENSKGTFRVLHVQESMTTLISMLRKKKNPLAVTQFFGYENPEYELLKTIKIGDKVKIINRI